MRPRRQADGDLVAGPNGAAVHDDGHDAGEWRQVAVLVDWSHPIHEAVVDTVDLPARVAVAGDGQQRLGADVEHRSDGQVEEVEPAGGEVLAQLAGGDGEAGCGQLVEHLGGEQMDLAQIRLGGVGADARAMFDLCAHVGVAGDPEPGQQLDLGPGGLAERVVRRCVDGENGGHAATLRGNAQASPGVSLMTMTDTAATDTTSEIMIVTDAARATVLDIRSNEDDADSLGLRVEVTGASGVDYTYDLSLEPVAEAADDDHLHTNEGLTVIIPANSVDAMRGATLDLPSVAGQGGLVIRNPNRPNPLGDLGQLELTGDAAAKIQTLLAERINPALAAHGGYAELIGVEGEKAFVTMGGGCQGCSMSAATLQEGIQRAILEAVPEITEVVDTTDHGQGENPYYS